MSSDDMTAEVDFRATEPGEASTPTSSAPSGALPGRPVRHRQRPQAVAGPTLLPEAPEVSPAPTLADDGADDGEAPDLVPDPEAEAEAQARHDDAHTARLREVLRLTAQHLPQAEIARRYAVTVRTVRRWVDEARQRRLGTFKRATADELLAETEHLHATLMAKLLRRMEVAEAVGDDRLWLECMKRIQAVERDRYAIREKVGFFDAYRLGPPIDDATDRHARMQRMALRLAILARAYQQASGEDPQADVDDAAEMEELRIAEAVAKAPPF